MKIVSLFLFLISFKVTIANEIEVSIILENCKSCHGESYEGNEYISSLKMLKKNDFITRMNDYIIRNDSEVMSRISKVLNKSDVLEMADEIYGNK